MLKGKDRVITHEVGQGLLREMSRCFPEDLKAVVRHDPGGRVLLSPWLPSEMTSLTEHPQILTQ